MQVTSTWCACRCDRGCCEEPDAKVDSRKSQEKNPNYKKGSYLQLRARCCLNVVRELLLCCSREWLTACQAAFVLQKGEISRHCENQYVLFQLDPTLETFSSWDQRARFSSARRLAASRSCSPLSSWEILKNTKREKKGGEHRIRKANASNEDLKF